MCSVGDLKNNLRILQSEARQMKYTGDFDLDGLTKGNPHALLPLYNYIFTTYNHQFAAEVLELLDDNLYMKSDVRFMEAIYRVLRDMFHFKPSMTKEQFFTLNNFAERKVIMCVEVMRLVQHHCRFLGPRNPTNPNIKVTSIVDTRRCNKKSSTDLLVTSEPNSEVALLRKMSDKGRMKPMSALMGITDDGWQLKAGYLRPGCGKDRPREEKREKSSKDSLEKEDGVKKEKSNGLEKPGVMASVVREFPPGSGKGKPVEVVHMPRDKQDKGHMRVMDMLPKTHSDWDPTEAVECILAKVRGLPAQLTNFMKAVESRLQKIEDRLDSMEGKVTSINLSEDQQNLSSEAKQHADNLQARLLLLENRVTLLESKAPSPGIPEGGKTIASLEEKKTEFTPGPFVSLERGEDLFSGNLASTFSPIRQDIGDYNLSSYDNTLTSVADGDRRLSSTPNQSVNTRLPPQNSSSAAESEKRTAVHSTDTTFAWENLDTSTQQQVERIKDMMKATQVLLPSTAGQHMDS